MATLRIQKVTTIALLLPPHHHHHHHHHKPSTVFNTINSDVTLSVSIDRELLFPWEQNEKPPAPTMPVSYSDLLCCEEDSSSIILSDDSPAESSSSDFEYSSFIDEEESIAGYIEDERHFVPGFDYLSQFQSHSLDASARELSVSWILTVQAYYGFQPLTAYLSVNYLDRFLYSRRMPQTNGCGWPMQLLSVACLSLAAKMEEQLVPSLLDLQVGGAKYIFEPRTIMRMEFLVLSVLDWRLRSITPFTFFDFFAWKIDPTGTYLPFLIKRATHITLSNVQEASFVEYRPSSIAAAAILCAASEIPNLSVVVNPEHAQSWCDGLSHEKVMRCYRLMHNTRNMTGGVVGSSTTSESSSSSSLSPSSYKRRKLNNNLWVEVDKRCSSARLN